jgi:glycosyltransferase involved in cell wall biosynthesis
MKILIVNNLAPFIWGGAEELATHLKRNLIAAGHESEVLRIPFQWEPATRIPSQMLMVRSLELWNVDRVIALKFPAYLIRHPHKTLWLLHQYRQAYDLLESGQSNLPDGEVGDTIRRAIVAADQEAFKESQRIFVNSKVTQDRLKKFNGVDSQVLLPPINDADLFTGGPGQGYVFAGGRINGMKRQHLLVEALAKTPANVKLVVAGPPDGPEDARRLAELVERHGLSDRVKLDLRFLPRHDYAAYLNSANAVAYLPFDEDSLGYVSMEAATASKALISTLDSGGVLGLARSGETGWVTEPHPGGLARALTMACTEPASAARLGEGARNRWQAMGITWPRTVERLLS